MTQLVPARLLTRISQDRTGRRVGVLRQREEGSTLAASLDWWVEREHCDNDKSAWKEGVERPGFELLLADIRAGRVKAVIAFDQDRVARTSEDWARFRRACRKHGVRVAFATERGEINIATVTGGVMTGMRAVMAESESEIKSERVLSASQERAMAGKAAGRCLYGWKRVVVNDARGNKLDWHDEIDPEQAAIVVEITKRFLAGESLRRIAADLDQRAVPTPNTGRKSAAKKGWCIPTLRNLMVRPANVGERVHQGRVLIDPRTGKPVVAQAPAILDRDDYDRACDILADPKRRTVTDSRIKHLLTSVSECGVCGEPMRFKTQRHPRGTNPSRAYVCSGRGCVGRAQDAVDELVTETVIVGLTTVDPAALLPRGDDEQDAAAQQADALRRKLARAWDDYQAELLDGTEYKTLKNDLKPKLQAAEAAAKASVSPGLALAHELAGARNVRRAWESLQIEQQRAVVAALLRVEVRPATVGHKGFDPASVRLTWRTAVPE